MHWRLAVAAHSPQLPDAARISGAPPDSMVALQKDMVVLYGVKLLISLPLYTFTHACRSLGICARSSTVLAALSVMRWPPYST